MRPMRFYLVRHAESELNAGLVVGPDCGLTTRGRSQAEAVGQQLAGSGLTRILTSPYRRCLETAEAVRVACGAPGELFPAMHEHHHTPFAPGDWPLPAIEELGERFPDFAAPPGVRGNRWAAVPEDRERQWRRVSGAVRALLERFGGGESVAIVSHHAPLSVFVQAFCGWTNPLNVGIHFANASLTTLEVDREGRRHLISLNVPTIG